MPHPSRDVLLRSLVDLVGRAERIVLDIYHSDFTVLYKDDASPVTLADREAEKLLSAELPVLLPGVPVIGEEAVSEHGVPNLPERFWLVDPVDGTKEFLKRNDEFTINIGLIEQGRPVLGVVSAPALGEIWAGFTTPNGEGQAFKGAALSERIACRVPPPYGAVVLTSRSHRNPEMLDEWLSHLDRPVCDYRGSSLKLCRVAEGSADYTPRFGPTSEWDTAAAHAVLYAAGGNITALDTGLPLVYGKPALRNPFFLGQGRTAG